MGRRLFGRDIFVLLVLSIRTHIATRHWREKAVVIEAGVEEVSPGPGHCSNHGVRDTVCFFLPFFLFDHIPAVEALVVGLMIVICRGGDFDIGRDT